MSGPIVDLRVADNQFVKQGDLLFAIDCRPYEARLDRARADLALTLKEVDAQRRTIASTNSETARRESSLAATAAEVGRAEEERAAAEAAVAKLQAEAAYAADYLGRVERLVDRQFVTTDKVAEARSRRDASAAAVQQAQRQLRAADAAVKQGVATRQAAARAVEQSRYDVSRAQDLLAQVGDVNARVQAAEASVRAAELDVGYCRVTRPLRCLRDESQHRRRRVRATGRSRSSRLWTTVPGTCSPTSVRRTCRPSSRAWRRTCTFSAIRGRRFRGVVQGIGWANKPQDGATVGVLPDVQQTLNWVRLANRFQVRVRLEEHDAERPFRMGTTAVVTIRGFPGGTALAPPTR